MRVGWSVALFLLPALSAPSGAQAPVGTAFTYQGRLFKDGAVYKDGTANLSFELYDAASGGTRVAGPVAKPATPVDASGLLTVQIDFGSAGFVAGEARWLQVTVNGTLLSPRDPVTPTPYSMVAQTVTAPLLLQANAASTGTVEAVNTNQAGIGLLGEASAASGNTIGVRGKVTSATGFAGYFEGGRNHFQGSVGIGTATPYRKLEIVDTADGALTFPAKVVNAQNDAGTAAGILFQVDGGGDRGKGALVYTRTDSWNRGSFHILQNNTADSSIVTLADSVLEVTNDGKVGIGTTDPQEVLHISSTGAANLRITNETARKDFEIGVNGVGNLRIAEADVADRITIAHTSGYVGIGTTVPAERLHVDGDTYITGNLGIGVQPSSSDSLIVRDSYPARFEDASGNPMAFLGRDPTKKCGLLELHNAAFAYTIVAHADEGDGGPNIDLLDPNGVVTMQIDGNGGGGGGYLALYNSAGTKTIELDADDDDLGVLTVDVLEISGADVAERFPVSEQIEPGMVVVIDAENPGQLCLSRTAYDRKVAGVVSGAGDLNAGTILGNRPGSADGPPVALSGRVWVRCDARRAAIEPGDLLTTSDTPGHAMKVGDHGLAQGAVIGKAMSRLASQCGLVLVLVQPQ